jgi:hypothetical protein
MNFTLFSNWQLGDRVRAKLESLRGDANQRGNVKVIIVPLKLELDILNVCLDGFKNKNFLGLTVLDKMVEVYKWS